eukprot:1703173-Pleurochrysis_carterae.AAC.1
MGQRRRVVGRWVSGRGGLEGRVGQGRQRAPSRGVGASNVDGFSDRPNEVAQLAQAVRVCRCTGTSLPLTLKSALAVSRLGLGAL